MPPTRRDPADRQQELRRLLKAAGATRRVADLAVEWVADPAMSTSTRRARMTDLTNWAAWCAEQNLNPADPGAGLAPVYDAAMQAAGLGEPTRARRISNASSWYRHLNSHGLGPAADPLARHYRAPRPEHTVKPAVDLTEDQAAALLRRAFEAESPRTFALLLALYLTGAKLGRVLATTTAAYTDSGLIGGREPPPLVIWAVDRYLDQADRPTDWPLFATEHGTAVTQDAAYRTVRRVAAEAGLPNAGQLSAEVIRRAHNAHTEQQTAEELARGVAAALDNDREE